MKIGHNPTRRRNHNMKSAPIIIMRHWSKKNAFLFVQTVFFNPYVCRFCKNDSNSSLQAFGKKCNLRRVFPTSFLNVIRVKLPKFVTRIESNHWLESRCRLQLAVISFFELVFLINWNIISLMPCWLLIFVAHSANW